MIITLQECGSTNTELKNIIRSGRFLPSGATVRAVTQTAGRGQRGNTWEAQPGKNLTFSTLLRPGGLLPAHHFIVSQAIAIAIATFLEKIIEGLPTDKITIKWPNDIYYGDRKIAGILIENALDHKGRIIHTIAGIGININQTTFSPSIPNPISLRNITDIEFDLDALMPPLARSIADIVNTIAPAILAQGSAPHISQHYHNHLWRRDGFHNWRDTASGTIFSAAIHQIMPSGQLILRLPDENTIGYMFKEVEAIL